MIISLFELFQQQLNFEEKEIRNMSSLVLAYIGDAVYEVFIRTMLIKNNAVSVNQLHRLSINYVKAKAQCDILQKILDKLTEEEKDIVRRGRNAKSGTIPKNASVSDYKYATGFESLIGFLYLKNDFIRLMEILKIALE